MKIFVGYDSREPLAYHVYAHSINARASKPFSITPLIRSQLMAMGAYTREVTAKESTEFSMTRFLVPYLSNYEGYSIFADCDMLAQADFCELFKIIEEQPDKAIYVCKHDYTPSSGMKFLNQVQSVYPRKNWSSFVIFNNSLCKALTPEYVNSASGLDLHRFNWTTDDMIGELPVTWNWLVGEYASAPDDVKNVHFTLGGPWFNETKLCDFSEQWREELKKVTDGYDASYS